MTTVTQTTTQVHQVYIKATPEQIWEAITTPAFVAQYFFGTRVESTCQVGSPIRYWSPDRSKLWGDNTVLESDPPRRFSYTWKSLYDAELAEEEESRVTWEIEPQEGGISKLTVIHDRLDGAPKTADRVSGGWMLILSGLKTLLETGKPLKNFS